MSGPPANLEGLQWPDGEPGPLRSAGHRLHGLASSFDGAAGRLPGAVPASWSGVAAGSYSSLITQAGTAVDHVATSLTHVGAAYAQLADVIEQAQDTVRKAAAKLHAARVAAKKAQAAATAARSEANTARATATMNAPLVPLAGTDPLSAEADAAEGRANAAEGAAATASAEAARIERWAQGESDRANADVKRADATCAGALDGTGMTGELPVNGAAVANGAQAVWNFVYDVALKPLNPWDPGYNTGESNTVWGGYASGLLFGTSEWTSRYASENWMKTVPGYWERAPRWVAPYMRSTPSGGTTQVSGYMRSGVWHGAEEVPDMATRASWASKAEMFGKAGTVAAFVTAGAGQYFDDMDNPNLNGAERTGRVITQSATVGTASALGGWGGAAAGAAIGTAICPGVGTVIGGVAGGIIGGGVAGGLVDHFNDSVVKWGGDAADTVAGWGDDVGDFASDTVDKIKHIDLTPW